MSIIDWTATQRKLKAAPDGVPGRQTFGLLLAATVGSAGNITPSIERVAQSLAANWRTYGMTSRWRMAEFVAEMAHECALFTRFEENLNYSAQGLATTWPSRYAVDPKAKVKKPNARALGLARRPEAIANDTYALRMGNLDAAHDNDSHPDGWQYRGRGPFMLTGKANYALYGAALGLDLVGNPDLAGDPFVGTRLALHYWQVNRINDMVDRSDYAAARRAVNGGSIGELAVQRLRNIGLGLLV